MSEFLDVFKSVAGMLGGIVAFVGVLFLIALLMWRGAVALKLNPVTKSETKYEITVDKESNTVQFKKSEESKVTFKGAEE